MICTHKCTDLGLSYACYIITPAILFALWLVVNPVQFSHTLRNYSWNVLTESDM